MATAVPKCNLSVVKLWSHIPRTNSSENDSHSIKYCIFYYPDQQIHNIYINNILYVVSTPTCFYASATSSGSLNFVLC